LLRAQGPLTGTVVVPGDKSVSHRAALFPLLADGPCRATGWLASADTLASLAAVRTLGARADHHGDTITVDASGGPAPALLSGETPLHIDCGNSGTTTRLLCGLLAGWLPPAGPGVVLDGDASLRSRPMGRVVAPLLAMGARIDFLGDPDRLPLRVRGASLVGREHVLPVPSAQLKSALLLAGLHAVGETTVAGGGGSRDHTERLLAAMGRAPVVSAGERLTISAARPLRAFDIRVPGDPSTAAFIHVAAALVPGSRLTVPGLSLGPGRVGYLDALRSAGAEVRVSGATDTTDIAVEPAGDVTVAAAPLSGFTVEGPEVPGLVDELPVLAVLATRCAGETVISGAQELRVKESDRIALMTRGLRALGADVTERDDGMIIRGPSDLRGGTGDPVVHATGGDHRIAMALAIAALVSEGESALDDIACVAVSFPDFFPTLDRLLAD